MNRVLVTGATGFVGRALCGELARAGLLVRATTRSGAAPQGAAEQFVVSDIGATTEWSHALDQVDIVVHTAARAHVMDDRANSMLYTATNVAGTQRLAEAAAQAGVRRFVYLSSIKVNGEEVENYAYGPDDEPHPRGPYGTSKWLGEQALMAVAASCRMQAVVVRSPIVYGPGVRANFLRLMRWVEREWPLPLGAVRNRRSLVSIWNLCSFLTQVTTDAAADGGTWMVSDGADLSTPELIRRLAVAMRRRPRLVRVPVTLLRLCGALSGRSAEIARLCGSLTVDLSRTRTLLGWSPPVTIDEALARTATWYLAEGRGDVG